VKRLEGSKAVLTAAGMVVLLSGCNMVASLIPPIPANNPLGLNRQSITLTVGPSGLTPQSQGTPISGSLSFTFQDMPSVIDLPIAPNQLNACYDFTVQGPVPQGAPESLTLTDVRLDLTISDEGHNPVQATITAGSVTLTATNGQYTGEGKNLCGTFSNAGELIAIRKDAPEPNRLTGTFQMVMDVGSGTMPQGATLTITFKNGKGTIKF